jgi:hypothetical protein
VLCGLNTIQQSHDLKSAVKQLPNIRNDLALSNVTIISYHILSAELASPFGSAIHEQKEDNGIK